MALVSEHFSKLPGNYLFSDIAKKVSTFKVTHPKQDIIRLGVGNVTRPLPKAYIETIYKAVEKLASRDTFHGHGPKQGYDFLIEAIIESDSIPRGIHFSASETFINGDTKSDTGGIGDILRHDNSVDVTDPICPVYIDSNVMYRHAGVSEEEMGKWSSVTYMPCASEDNFIPKIPGKQIGIVYLCYPNNPTRAALTKSELKKWMDYALANGTLILFNIVYEAYIQDENVPHSVCEIKGAKKCTTESCNFSEATGFTGIHCGHTVVLKELTVATPEEDCIPPNRLWSRRRYTKFNGTSYTTQRTAEAVYSAEGRAQIKETIGYYMTNAEIIKGGLEAVGLEVYGGVSAPYLWAKTSNGLSSWRFFGQMLCEANMVGTPGVGFGLSGGGYIHLTAFGEHNDCIEAMRRIKSQL